MEFLRSWDLLFEMPEIGQEEAIKELLGMLHDLLRTGNASVWRQIIDAAERRRQPPIDQARSWLANEKLLRERGAYYRANWEKVRELVDESYLEVPALPDAAQLNTRLKADGINISVTLLRRMCKEMEIDLAPGEVGRPKKLTPKN